MIIIYDTLRKSAMNILNIDHADSTALTSQARKIVYWSHINNNIYKITKKKL